MEVSAEAKRIMVVALGKLYGSRTQRGGLRLHRSLLLTLVMKSARDMYHEAQAAKERRAAAGWEVEEEPEEAAGAHTELQGAAELHTGPEPELSTGPELHTGPEVSTIQEPELRHNAENKENRIPAQHSRKRRGRAAVEPDFLPCKKAKLDCSQQLVAVSAVILDYVTCSSELGAPPPPIPLPRAVAAC